MSLFPQQPVQSQGQSQANAHQHLYQQQTAPQPVIPSPPSPVSQPGVVHPSRSTQFMRPPAPFSFPAAQSTAMFPQPPQLSSFPSRELPPDTPLISTDIIQPHESATTLYKKRLALRIGAFLIVPLLVGVFIFIWYSSPSSTTSGTITQQNFTSSSTSSSSNSNTPSSSSNYSNSTGNIQVYIVGAIKQPGVYQLPSDSRVYQLIQAAGGPLPKANLVAINLAAKLTDGEEVYVTLIGEVPPTYMGGVPGPGAGSGTPGAGATGQLVNINTASADQMRTSLHVSSATAQSIINYRTANGPFTSVDQLLQVVSKEIYDKIKGLVTV